MVSGPLDLSFTTFVGYPGTPSTPGAADINRIQNALTWLSAPPSAALSYTNTAIIASGFTPTVLQWNNKQWANTTGMVASTLDSTHPTDRISFPFVGKWRCSAQIRTQYNVTAGWAQLQLIYTDSLGDEVAAADGADPHATNPRFLTAQQDLAIDAAHVSRGGCIRAQFSQSSGGASTITSDSLLSWPRLTMTWIGTS